MRKIYRLDSSYTNREIDEIVESLPKEVRTIMEESIESIDIEEFYLQEDGCFSRFGDGQATVVCILSDSEKERLLDMTNRIYEKSRYTIEDISEKVLFGRHSEKDYRGVEEHVKVLFDRYIDDYLDHDAVLDKINMYGMASLSERDKRVLEENI